MIPVPCVFFKQHPMIRRWLRTMVLHHDCVALCPGAEPEERRTCQARAFLDDVIPELTPEGCIPVQKHDLGDPRWPVKCGRCGNDISERGVPSYSVDCDWLYFNTTDIAKVVPLRDMPVGAIWHQDFGQGADSIHFLRRNGLPESGAGKHGEISGVPHTFVCTPDGPADLDAPSNNGDGWIISGEMPKLTASPSIWMNHPHGWHGYLRDGFLTS